MPHAPNFFAIPPWRRAGRCLATLVALAGAGAAGAQNVTLGIAAGPDRGKVDCVASFACDRSSTSFKLTGAYRLSEAVDVQAVYFGSGKFEGGDTTPLGTEFGGSFKVSGFGLTAGYRWDLVAGWSLAARLGAAGVRTRFRYAPPFDGSASKTTLQPLGGIGIGYAVTPALRVGLDYDITRFKVHTTRGPLQMLGLAAQYSF